MRLYSRGQLVFYSLLSGVLVALFAVGLGLIKVPSIGLSLAAKAVQSEERTERIKSIPASELQQSAATNQAIPVVELVPYTEDERENIGVYERLN